MEQLNELIKTLRIKAEEYNSVLVNNETMTRYVLIDPLLRELGWDLTDPNTVVMEESTPSKKRVDYRMGKTMIIEAKSSGKTPKRSLMEKYLDSDIQYAVVTNGIQWNVFVKSKITPEYAFNLNDDPKSFISNAINLHRIIASEGISESEAERTVETEPTSDDYPSGQIPIAMIQNPLRNPPTRLYFPDASSVKLSKWIDILASTTKWLIDNKHLSELNCPIQYTPKSTIVNFRKEHKNGIPFKSGKRVYQFFINSNLGQTGVKQYTIKLLDTLGFDSSKFRVSFDK